MRELVPSQLSAGVFDGLPPRRMEFRRQQSVLIVRVINVICFPRAESGSVRVSQRTVCIETAIGFNTKVDEF